MELTAAAFSKELGPGQYGVGKAVAPRRYMWLILKEMHHCMPVPYIPHFSGTRTVGIR